MNSDSMPVTMTMTKPESIHGIWRPVGEVVEVPAEVARYWVAAGFATLGGQLDTDDASNVVIHQLGEFPAADKFAAAGLANVQQIREFIGQHGDNWPKQIKGITKAIASKVSEELEKLAAAETAAAEVPAAE